MCVCTLKYHNRVGKPQATVLLVVAGWEMENVHWFACQGVHFSLSLIYVYII